MIGSPIIDLPAPFDNSPAVMDILSGLLNNVLDDHFNDISIYMHFPTSIS